MLLDETARGIAALVEKVDGVLKGALGDGEQASGLALRLAAQLAEVSRCAPGHRPRVQMLCLRDPHGTTLTTARHGSQVAPGPSRPRKGEPRALEGSARRGAGGSGRDLRGSSGSALPPRSGESYCVSVTDGQAFNTELDGMYNDTQLPPTPALEAMRRDLQETKASRNDLALENMRLKRELEEANLKREQWARILRERGIL